MTDRLPNLLLIGAMKSGTSSLYADLTRHPEIYFPATKETMGYLSMAAGDREAERVFRGLFTGRTERYLGDASTGYSKFPYRGDAAQAVRSAGTRDVRVLYMQRDPICRIERHIAHHLGNGVDAPEVLDIHTNPEFAYVSAYRMQESLWRKALGADSVLTVSFEMYRTNRAALLERIFAFLGLDASDLVTAPPTNVNRAENRRSAYRSPLRHVIHSHAYARLRERLPRGLRRTLADLMLPRARQADVKLDAAQVAFLTDAIAELDRLDAPSAEQARAAFDAVLVRHGPDLVAP